MARRHFGELLKAKWAEGKFACVGLDSDLARVRQVVRNGTSSQALHRFNIEILEATKDLVCAYKPNLAFYLSCGVEGLEILRSTISLIRDVLKNVPVILDAKVGDIGKTNDHYAQALFDYFGADAITVNPYPGMQAMMPFLRREEKGIFVLCRMSNPGSDEFQDVPCGGIPFYQVVAGHAGHTWNTLNHNCGVVAAATFPRELKEVRRFVGHLPILIPGVGAQRAELAAAVENGKDDRGQGIIINSSSSIIFASSGPDFAEAARRETQKLHDGITACLRGGNKEASHVGT